MSGRRDRKTIIVFAIIVVAAVAALALAWPPVNAWRLRALFEGPAETPAEAKRGVYPGIDYDFSAWVARSGDNSSADPMHLAAAPEFGDLMGKPAEVSPWQEGPEPADPHAEWKVDAATGATKVARLRSPTVWREPWPHRALTITSPADNALFPPNITAPYVTWEDSQNNLWRITLRKLETRNPKLEPQEDSSSESGAMLWSAVTTERRVRIPDDIWAKVVAAGPNASARIEVRGVNRSCGWWKSRSTIHAAAPVTLLISEDPADNFVVYRLVEPPFINHKTPDMFTRDIRELSPRPFLLGHKQYCFNCHTFSSKSGDTGRVSVQVRYNGKADTLYRTYVAFWDFDRRAGYKAILPFDVQMTTFMAWSPDGMRLATSANQKITAFNPVVHETQSVGQPESDLAVFDTTSGLVCLLPGASEKDVLEIYPSWTPDGKAIVYSSAPAGRHPTATKFDLRIIPYNEGKGGAPRDIPGAAANGRSNFYARFSPDGRWMSFVEADSDSLIKQSSDIYLLPADAVLGGKPAAPRRLESNAAGAADSWHSWSSNSRWLVFASKRDDGIYTRLYMTHIDAVGHASVAVALPVADADERMCYNIPEFVAHAPAVSEPQLYDSVGLGGQTIRVKSSDKADNDPSLD